MNRRQVLKASGWTAGGLTVLSVGGCGLIPPLPTFGGSSQSDAFAWIKLDAEGEITFLLPRAEIGQGIDTGLTLVVAEELQLSPERIRCVHQRTDQMAPCQMTVGSQSIENYQTLTAFAAAALREALIGRAAEQTGESPSTLRCEEGVVRHSGGSVTWQSLLRPGEQSIVPVTTAENLVLRITQPEPRFFGKSDRLRATRDIVTGAERYSRDIVLPGMLFGSVAHPPQLGASLVSCDMDAARRVPDVEGVFTGPDDAVGVVGASPMVVQAALEALACTWTTLSEAEVAQADVVLDIDEAVQTGLLDHKPTDTGSLAQGREAAVAEVNSRYDTPMAAHASMEPRAGVAQPTDAGLEVWTGSQDPWYVRSAISKALGISAERVVVHNCRVGGAFGGRVHCQASFEAAWLARAAQKPVKVQWSREDEFRHNYVGPQFSTRVSAGLDAQGTISYWHHQMVGAPVLTSSMLIPPRLHWLANLPADPGTIRGTETPYAIANHRIETGDVRVPMPTGPWRGLGAAPNTFAVECAVDELAAAGDADPIELRVRNARDSRLAGVLQRLHGRIQGEPDLGIAATAYKGVTFVAIAAQVDVTGSGVRVRKLWCVHDCGQMTAPDRVLAQVEGNLVWGVSMALSERFELANGTATTDNFDRYGIARQADMPELDIELIDSTLAPSGAAEAALAPAAAAIANAVSRVTGRRQRALPLTVSA